MNDLKLIRHNKEKAFESTSCPFNTHLLGAYHVPRNMADLGYNHKMWLEFNTYEHYLF